MPGKVYWCEDMAKAVWWFVVNKVIVVTGHRIKCCS